MKSTIGLLLILFFLLIAQVSIASTQFTGVASQAMGGTGRAAVIPNEVAFLNPASFVSVRGYNLATAYRDFQTLDKGSTRNFAIHASENQTDSMFPLAITYLKTRDINSGAYGVREDIHLTTGQEIFGNVAFGIDVARYTDTPEGGKEETEWDAKVGFLYAPMDNLGLGLVFTNLLVTDLEHLKRGVEVGVNYLFMQFFRAALDVTYQMEDNESDESVVMFGIEHMYFKQIALRAGAKWDAPINQNYWTLGLAWNAPKISFGYAFEKNVAETDEYGHSVDLRIYF
ncbi:MAG: hypothetical protein V4596_09915 [Bdellovibrionota bacterium]